MSWNDLDPRIRELAQQVLTHRQLETYMLSVNGHSGRSIAYQLDVARSTVSDHLDSAYRKLRAHGLRFDPDGRPYLQETP